MHAFAHVFARMHVSVHACNHQQHNNAQRGQPPRPRPAAPEADAASSSCMSSTHAAAAAALAHARSRSPHRRENANFHDAQLQPPWNLHRSRPRAQQQPHRTRITARGSMRYTCSRVEVQAHTRVEISADERCRSSFRIIPVPPHHPRPRSQDDARLAIGNFALQTLRVHHPTATARLKNPRPLPHAPPACVDSRRRLPSGEGRKQHACTAR